MLRYKYSFWMTFVMSEIDSNSIERFGPFFLYVLGTHSLSPYRKVKFQSTLDMDDMTDIYVGHETFR